LPHRDGMRFGWSPTGISKEGQLNKVRHQLVPTLRVSLGTNLWKLFSHDPKSNDLLEFGKQTIIHSF
jgi:hypothetical protein